MMFPRVYLAYRQRVCGPVEDSGAGDKEVILFTYPPALDLSGEKGLVWGSPEAFGPICSVNSQVHTAVANAHMQE